MRVCDITREDEVVSAYTIIKHEPGADLGPFTDDRGFDAKVIVTIEAGKRADAALGKQDWSELGRLVPYALRAKNPARTEGAKKAQATKAAKKAAAAAEGGVASENGQAAPATAAAPAAPQAAAKTAVGA